MINTISEINKYLKEDEKAFVTQCEKEYQKIVSDLARLVSEDDDIKIVSIAGPSSSGKTTTAYLLKKELIKLSETVQVVSLDDFYLSGDNLPVLENG